MFKNKSKVRIVLVLVLVGLCSALALYAGIDRELDKEMRAAQLEARSSATISRNAEVDPDVLAKQQMILDEQVKLEAELANAQNVLKSKKDEWRPGKDAMRTKDEIASLKARLSLSGHPSIKRSPSSIFVSEDFEGATFPPPMWDTINTDPGYGFFQTSWTGGGTQGAFVTWHAAGFIQDEWLLTPPLNVSTANPAELKIEFWMLKGYTYPHDFKVYVDAGAGMVEVWDAASVAYPDFQWYAVSIPIGAYAGGSDIVVGFQYYGEDADLFGLDDISINDDVVVTPTGRCCSGDPASPTCTDGLTQAECTALSGAWQEGADCASSPCPLPGGNDECVNAEYIAGPYPTSVSGTTVGATIDCPGDPDIGDWDAVWYEIELPYAVNNVVIDYCGTAVSPPTISATLFTSCTCDAAARIYFDDGAYVDCGDGVGTPVIGWNGVPGPGTIYYAVWTGGVKADMRAQQAFTFTVDITEPPPAPANDDCATAQEVSDVVDLAFSTTTATADGAGYTTGPNIWYAYTATCDGNATVSLCGSTYDTKIAAYDGVTCSPLGTMLSSNDDFCSLQSEITFPVVAGNQYLIEVGGYSTSAGDGLLNISCAAGGGGSPGDNCSNPLKIDIPALPYSDIGQTTCGRGNSYEDPSDAICMGYYTSGEDIFYEVTVTSTIQVYITLDPKGTSYAGMGLFTSCPPSLTNCVDFVTSSSSSPKSMNCVSLDPGVYYLMIDTWASPNCIPDFDLTITEATGCGGGGGPENDDCANATPVGNVVDLAFNTDAASYDGTGTCLSSPNIWYVYTATCDGEVVVSLCGSGYDTKLAAYDGGTCGSPELACNDDFCSLQSEVSFIAVAGNQYLIEVGGYASSTGSGILNITCSDPCKVDCPPGAITESEACGADENGGCNSTVPAFQTIECGQPICGTAWADAGSRDTDWLEFTLTTNSEVTWTAVAEFPLATGFIETTSPGSIDCSNITGSINPFASTNPCDTAVVTTVLPPGTHWIFVGDQGFTGNPCGSGFNTWTGTLTCTPVAPTYCAASGGCDEYIEQVTVGTIDNLTACDNYGDYTALSTQMEIGVGYPITIAIGNAYNSDEGAVWVDWNQDLDFDDPGEQVVLDVSSGVGPYTGTITPPADALGGSTRMRVRLVWGSTPTPCGTTSYGEVEDYTINLGLPMSPAMVLDPDMMYAMYYYAITPMTGHIYIGGPDAGDVNLIDQASILINGTVTPTAVAVVTDAGGYTGDVLDISFSITDFLAGYMPAWDNMQEPFSVSGTLNDATPFDFTSAFWLRGHISGDINLDKEINVADLTMLVGYLFKSGEELPYKPVADMDKTCEVNVSDLMKLVDRLFKGGSELESCHF